MPDNNSQSSEASGKTQQPQSSPAKPATSAASATPPPTQQQTPPSQNTGAASATPPPTQQQTPPSQNTGAASATPPPTEQQTPPSQNTGAPQVGQPLTVALPPGLAQLLMAAAAQRAALPYAPGGLIAGGALPGIQTQQTLQIWQGQYPPPDAVEHYERVLPGSFDRMIGMAERLQAAQIDGTKRGQDYTRDDTRRGHWLGFAIAVLAMLGAFGCLELKYPWVATVFLSVPVMAVAKALIESARSNVLASSTKTFEPSAQPPPVSTPSSQTNEGATKSNGSVGG